MRKEFVLAMFVVGVVLLLPFAYPASRSGPFRVRVIDERTGAGIPNARVIVENGAVSTTEFDGSVLFWLDAAHMDRTVRFTIEQRSVTTTVGLLTSRGGLSVVPLPAP